MGTASVLHNLCRTTQGYCILVFTKALRSSGYFHCAFEPEKQEALVPYVSSASSVSRVPLTSTAVNHIYASMRQSLPPPISQRYEHGETMSKRCPDTPYPRSRLSASNQGLNL